MDRVAARFGVDEGALVQNFHGAVMRLHRRLAPNKPPRTITLDVSFYCDPEDVPGASDVSLSLHVVEADKPKEATPHPAEDGIDPGVQELRIQIIDALLPSVP